MTTQTSTPTGVKRTESKGIVTIDKIEPAKFKKDTLQAQLRQIFTTVSAYPSQKVESDMQKGLFATSEFGFTEQTFESVENRIAFLFIPQGTTKEALEAKLKVANENKAIIYRVLSNKPILDENQKAGITAGQTTEDIIGDAQAVRFPKGHAQEGLLIKDKNSNVQYRRTFFWDSPKEDVDLRNTTDVYLTEKIAAEVLGASKMAGQAV